MKKLTFISFLFSVIVSCQESPVIQNIYGDKKFTTIRESADQRDIAKLIEFMKSSDDSVRMEAAKGAISLHNEALIEPLFDLVRDVNEQTRVYAAAALGNSRSPEIVSKLTTRYSVESATAVKRELLIAIGKTYSSAKTSSFESSELAGFLRSIELLDDEEKIGFGVMLQHLHRKELYSASLMRRCQFALQTSNAESREALTWAMATFKGMWLQTQSDYFSNWMKTERNLEVKLPLLIAYARSSDDNSSTLKSYASARNASHQINVAAIQLLLEKGVSDASYFISTLEHPDDKVVIEALKALASCNISKDQVNIENAVNSRSAAVQSAWYSLQHHHKIDKDGKACLGAIAAAKTPYDKAFYIRALGNVPDRCDDLITAFYEEKNPVVLYALTETLCEYYLNDNWKGNTSFMEIAKAGVAKHDSGVCDMLLGALESKQPGDSEYMDLRPLLDAYYKTL